jgi:hypothetical protein
VRALLWVATANGHDALALGAMGCGAFHCLLTDEHD